MVIYNKKNYQSLSLINILVSNLSEYKSSNHLCFFNIIQKKNNKIKQKHNNK
jgi:hypothetical protein